MWTLISFSFCPKCTNIFHAAFICPIHLITSKESSVCFFMLAFIFSFASLSLSLTPLPLFSIHFLIMFVSVRALAHTYILSRRFLLVINYALGCLAKSLFLAKSKMQFRIRLRHTHTPIQWDKNKRGNENEGKTNRNESGMVMVR